MAATAAIATAALTAAATGAAAAGQRAQVKQAAKAKALQDLAQSQAQERQQRATDIRRAAEERQLEAQRARALAAKRARFGASGIDSNAGSAGALLAGLNQQFDDQKATENELLKLQEEGAASQQGLSAHQDLLAETREKTRSRLAAFGTAQSLGRTGLSLLPS
ncbi:MAG: hypothetical protein ACPGOV_13330 [Magnetovibrionaceae bacterium]